MTGLGSNNFSRNGFNDCSNRTGIDVQGMAEIANLG